MALHTYVVINFIFNHPLPQCFSPAPRPASLLLSFTQIIQIHIYLDAVIVGS